MKSTFTVKKIAGAGIFTALVVVLQLFSNYVTLGPVSITLALIPMAIGAMIYGPVIGLWLGLVMGALVLIAPSTQPFICATDTVGKLAPLYTAIVCLTKGGLAGFVSGLIYKLIHKKNELVGVGLASFITPVVNTGIFTVFSFTLFYPLIKSWAGTFDVAKYFFFTIIGWNFLIELGVIALLTPSIKYIMKIFNDRYREKETKKDSEESSND